MRFNLSHYKPFREKKKWCSVYFIVQSSLEVKFTYPAVVYVTDVYGHQT
jgi:hypothetical protein